MNNVTMPPTANEPAKPRYPNALDALLPKKPGDKLTRFAIDWAVDCLITNEEVNNGKVPRLVRLAYQRALELDPALWFADHKTAIGVARYIAIRAAQAGARDYIPRDITIEMQP